MNIVFVHSKQYNEMRLTGDLMFQGNVNWPFSVFHDSYIVVNDLMPETGVFLEPTDEASHAFYITTIMREISSSYRG